MSSRPAQSAAGPRETGPVFGQPGFDDHEQVMFVRDRAAGLRGIIAVHDTTPGPALGGCRILPYADEAEALADVLRLSRGMTVKGAMAGLPFGGGKMVVIADPARDKTPALLHAVGRAIDRLGGRYITGEDVGTKAADMAEIGTCTRHVFGLPQDRQGSGDPSPSTALGCFEGIRACLAWQNGSAMLSGGSHSLDGVIVAIQGLGNVGMALAALLADAGASLVVADTDPGRVQEAVERFGAGVADPGAVHAVEADVFAPCALGDAIVTRTLPEIRARIVAGAANNQLASPEIARALRRAGVLYAPDFVINAGGMIQLAGEYAGFDAAELRRRIRAIGDTLREVFEEAETSGLSTEAAANRMAAARLRQARTASLRGGGA